MYKRFQIFALSSLKAFLILLQRHIWGSVFGHYTLKLHVFTQQIITGVSLYAEYIMMIYKWGLTILKAY